MVAEQFREIIDRPFSAETKPRPTLTEILQHEFSKFEPSQVTDDDMREFEEILVLSRILDARIIEEEEQNECV